jgi:hypothetical protein
MWLCICIGWVYMFGLDDGTATSNEKPELGGIKF